MSIIYFVIKKQKNKKEKMSMDLEQIKRERENALQQPMPRPEQEQAAGHDDDKNPELINSILKNYNGGGVGDEQPPQQRQSAPQQQYEEGEMDLRGNVETLEENAEEFQVGGGGAEIQYQYFNYLNEIKKVALIVVLVLLFNNPIADKTIYRYVKKFIFTGESLNWIGYVVKALLIGLLFFAISHFLLAL